MKLYKGYSLTYLKEYQFYFNEHISDEFNIMVANDIEIPNINESIERISIDGRSGDLIIKNGTYQDREINLKCKIVDMEAFWSQWDEINNWLTNVEDNKLYIDRDDRYYKVKYVEVGTIKKNTNKDGEFTIKFIVDPFLYDINGESVSIKTKNEFNINNFCDFEVEPVFKIFGTGNINVNVNGEEFTIKNINEYIIVDSSKMLCYKETTNMLSNMFGNFPVLKIGTNKIKLDGNITKVIVNWESKYR